MPIPVRLLATLSLGATLAAADPVPAPAPLIDLRIADGQRLIRHWNASLLGRAWQEPGVAPLRAMLDRHLPEVAQRIGFDPLEALAACGGIQARLVGLGDKPGLALRYHLQADLGGAAGTVFAAIRRQGRLADGSDGDQAVDVGDPASAMRVTLRQDRWLTAEPAAEAGCAPAPGTITCASDLELAIDGPRLADLIVALARQGHESKRLTPEAEVLLRSSLPYLTSRTDLTVDGFSSTLTASGSWSWLRPIDTRLWARLPAEVYDLNAFALDGPALWRDLAAPILTVIAQNRPGTEPGKVLAEAGIALTWEQLVNGLSGTWMLAQTPGMPLPGYTAIIPRSPAIDLVVAALVKKGGGELPAEGQHAPIPLPKGMPLMVSLARDQGHWVATTDLAFADTWMAPAEGARWTGAPLGALALEQAGADACLVAIGDTATHLRSAATLAGMALAVNREMTAQERAAVTTLLNRLAALAKPGWTVVRRGDQGLEGRSVGLASGNPSMVAVGAGMLLPAINLVRMSAKKANSANNLRQLALAAMVWSNDNDGAFPPDLATLVADSDGEVKPQQLRSPADPARDDAYLYVRPSPKWTASQPMILENPSLWKDGSCAVVFCDGHVARFPRAQAARIWAEAQRLATLPSAAKEGLSAEAWAAVQAEIDAPLRP